uniref:Uncharacterized protein n=1 Tax=Podoviridae sp. ctjUd6 TaxID=2825270 RepID=A0A8S5U2Q3_9CAUD|nr:MAG TPA: hypothetical protein [Podoviridae sp. ctjUd6]
MRMILNNNGENHTYSTNRGSVQHPAAAKPLVKAVSTGRGVVNIQNPATQPIGERWGSGRTTPPLETLNRYTPLRATQTPPTYPSTRTA